MRTMVLTSVTKRTLARFPKHPLRLGLHIPLGNPQVRDTDTLPGLCHRQCTRHNSRILCSCSRLKQESFARFAHTRSRSGLTAEPSVLGEYAFLHLAGLLAHLTFISVRNAVRAADWIEVFVTSRAFASWLSFAQNANCSRHHASVVDAGANT